MHDFTCFLRCVARAVVKRADRALAGLAPFGDVLQEVAVGTYQEYRPHAGTPLQHQLEGLAQADPSAVHQAAEEAASREAAGQSAAARRTLAVYLSQVRWTVRQSLRRPADPAGTTAPAGLCPRDPEELARFLPARLSRFQPGDQPLPGWELLELLGQGGFGEVWKARSPGQGGKLATLKFCLDPGIVPNLRSESATQVLARVRHLSHPMVGTQPTCDLVPLLETHLLADPPCLLYEYIEGGNLAGFIRERHPQGKLPPELAAQLVQGLASALAGAHRLNPPLVHGNLKLSNILVQLGEDGQIATAPGGLRHQQPGLPAAGFRLPAGTQAQSAKRRGMRVPSLALRACVPASRGRQPPERAAPHADPTWR